MDLLFMEAAMPIWSCVPNPLPKEAKLSALVNVYIYMYLHVNLHAYICRCMYVCMHACMYVCMYKGQRLLTEQLTYYHDAAPPSLQARHRFNRDFVPEPPDVRAF